MEMKDQCIPKHDILLFSDKLFPLTMFASLTLLINSGNQNNNFLLKPGPGSTKQSLGRYLRVIYISSIFKTIISQHIHSNKEQSPTWWWLSASKYLIICLSVTPDQRRFKIISVFDQIHPTIIFLLMIIVCTAVRVVKIVKSMQL